jgi:RNA polymerase sigma-54 factor
MRKMNLELQQKQILAQKLIMTLQLQQAIKLLPLSKMELMEKIHQELDENPALEEVMDASDENRTRDSVELYNYLDSFNYHKMGHSIFETKDSLNFETYTSARESLAEHLFWQLLMTSPTPEEEKIGSIIAGSLDDRGYLKSSIEDIAEMSSSELFRVKKVLELMQSFDPAGVCVRDLKECLLNQARNLGHQDSIVSAIIANHLNDVEKRDYKAISRALKASPEVITSAVNVIKGLEPIPARQFSGDKIQYIEPDVIIHRMEGDFVIELNKSGMPKLHLSPYYRNILVNGEGAIDAKAYLQDKMRAAEWLIKSIHQREKTIYRVMKSILKFQRDFFENGISHLKPMVVRNIAEDINMAESTISRATTNKYVQTAHGIFELKYFFSSFIQCSNGPALSSRVVQEKIKKIVAGEDSQRPLSDDKIAKILNDSNINIARRTVAKYREVMKIPSSRRRRQL